MLLKIPSNKKVVTTADLHINHRNICRGTSLWQSGYRDFSSLDEMNTTIINSINNSVGENDILLNLGDMFFGDKTLIPFWRNQIKCKEIHYIYGNHCDHIRKNIEYQNLFTSVQDYLEINYHSNNFVLFHYPISSWHNMHKNWIHIYGHVHGNYKNHGKSIDVGWDVYKQPIHLDTILDIMKDISIVYVDHHTSKKNESN